ncbi:biosynthetic arginine decarboxylase [Bacteriovorax sp. DB6_IX]|uniref:biosynthetic arginine decarboxylase n=1 Tax=Bacteriovorax sp. DB6_IX TaxID=1353530 RepID=UPI000389F0A4|nr:biosynthetic arginine decarboxylase [Bacteriovorax sp. DB6_IX]EQC51959.1 arginine 2-monooxygenase [Bacteriovorax sp. DB6_IX]
MSWTIDDADKTYGVSKWGAGHFTINESGQLAVVPKREIPEQTIVIQDVIDEMLSQGVRFPVVIRFHDILRSQVKTINRTFNNIIDEADYEGHFYGVYPVKVNQMREVVEEIVEAGHRYNFGLEAGSKAELMSVLAYNTNKKALTVLNGYKDEDYLRLALLGRRLGRKIVVVVEKFSELVKLIELSKETGVEPIIGIRSRMTVKGRGKWESSGGEKAKFGLTISEIINAVELLKENKLLDCLKLFHFHIGSQITDIRAIKEAIAEGARIYCKLFQYGVNLEYFDVGGGLGVDYDGTASTNDSSINYKLDEYVADIVYGLKQVCDLEDVPHPNIITESGRALTAHHSCVITNIIGEIDTTSVNFDTKKITGESHLVSNIREVEEDLDKYENWQEVYNDAVKLKEDSLNAFKLGILSLVERAKIETIYWRILKKVAEIVSNKEFTFEQETELEEYLSGQYLCNFSIFQSAADSWAIDQILPVVPIDRLGQQPSKRCSLVDITCDSDGKMDKFIDYDEGIKKTIPVHQLDGNPYYLGIFLTGAYQDVMGDMHNLFGRLNEVHVYAHEGDPKGFYIEEVIRGSSAADVLSTMQYNPQYMAFTVKKAIDNQISRGLINPRDGVKLVDFYEDCLKSYTYLK